MRFEAKLETNPPDLIRRLQGAREGWKREIKRELAASGRDAVRFARETFMTGGTTAWRTAVRSGRRRRAYAHKTYESNGRPALDYGPIRSAGGEVPLHARVHEGYDAEGRKVDRFVIRPRKGKFGRFPIRSGGGLAKGGIVGWRTYTAARPVILKPRPTFPAVEKHIVRGWPVRASTAMRRLFGEAL